MIEIQWIGWLQNLAYVEKRNLALYLFVIENTKTRLLHPIIL
jgi:hypothetical protein